MPTPLTNNQSSIEQLLKDFDEMREQAEAKHLMLTEEDIKSFLLSSLASQRESLVKEVLTILEDEIATAHTSKAGKTSRLTSAYMRIKQLIKSQ